MRCVVDSQRIDAAEAAVAIPMLGMANSLNVATAATQEAREPHGASVRAFRQAAWMRERSIIACVSNPLGIVPKARPQSPSRRVAQNASATAGVDPGQADFVLTLRAVKGNQGDPKAHESIDSRIRHAEALK